MIRNINYLILILLALIIILSGCADQQTNHHHPSNKETKKGPLNLMAGTVTRVVDGDTASIKLYSGREEKVRFIGVDTPETKHPSKGVEPYGPEASQYTKEQLTNKKVWIEIDAQERDKYGRILAYIWLSPPKSEDNTEIRSKMFNAKLLLNGYAQLLTIPPNVKYVDYFKNYQTEAREAKKGLWGINDTSKNQEETTGTYVGSINSNKYHYPECKWAKKINPDNKIWFKDSNDAKVHGYEPCEVCKPIK